METICPLSNSPCSGVLKFRLAANASANVASAVSLLWVMDGKAFQWDGSQDGEIGWTGYLTRSGDDPLHRLSRLREPWCGEHSSARIHGRVRPQFLHHTTTKK